jgi:hypothetical protein
MSDQGFFRSSLSNMNSHQVLLNDSHETFNRGHQVFEIKMENAAFSFPSGAFALSGSEPSLEQGLCKINGSWSLVYYWRWCKA